MVHSAWTHRTLARITMNGRFSGNAIVNVFHFEATTVSEATFTTDAAAQAALLALLADFTTTQTTTFLAIHSPGYTLQGLTGQILERPSNVSHALTAADYTTGYPKAGTNPFPDIGSTAVAAVIKWRSLVAGKSHRGRTYVGPIPENDTTSGILAGNGPTRMGAFLTSMMNVYGPTGTNLDWRLTVYSRPYDYPEYGYVKGSGPNRQMYFPPDYAGDSSNVLSGSVDTTLRTQRRREIGVGA
jgi:hypothetical protein